MKQLLLMLVLSVTLICTHAQAPNVEAMHETAQEFLKTGDYDNAILVLNKAVTLQPANAALQKDLMFATYLKRDFGKAREIGENLVKSGHADIRTYHMLGLVYKSIADYKEAEKLYKEGIKKFPAEGILYSEYGEMVADKNPDEAIKLFTKGMEADVNHSTNYYHVARHHAQNGDVLWAILHAETFLNLESFTARSTEIKNLLLDQYKKFFVSGGNAGPAKKQNEFIKNVASVLNQQQDQAIFGITPESLTVIRTRFVLQWFEQNADKFPYRLFEHQRQLLQEGLFDAYNQWLFGPAANLASYQLWQKYHAEDYNNYLAFVRSRVYRIPAGQLYNMF